MMLMESNQCVTLKLRKAAINISDDNGHKIGSYSKIVIAFLNLLNRLDDDECKKKDILNVITRLTCASSQSYMQGLNRPNDS